MPFSSSDANGGDQHMSLLAQLGISVSTDVNGRNIYTVNVLGAGQTSEARRACFHSDSQCWVLDSDNVSKLAIPLQASRLGQAGGTPHLEDWWVKMLPDTMHTTFLVKADWSRTSLGPVEGWTSALRSYTSMCLSKSLATILIWGKDRVAIYNEAAIPILGNRHPDLMGGKIAEKWPDIAEEFNSCFDQVESSGTGQILQAFCLPLERYEYLEETWWDADIMPLKEDDGLVGGFCFSWFEITRQVIADRFSRIVNEIGNILTEDDQDVWRHIRKVFNDYPRDIAMALLYSASSSDSGDQILKCEGTIGIDQSQEAAPPAIGLNSDSAAFASMMRNALAKREEYLVFDTGTDPVLPEVTRSIHWQGYGEPSKFVAVIPVIVFNTLLKGFVIIGLNPRIAMDTNLQQFLSDLSRQLRALLATVTSQEQAKQREDQLVKDLATKEKRIRKMAHLAPMGMYDLSAEGKLLWANNHFFDILGAQRSSKDFSTFSWLDYIHPDDHEAANIKMASSIIQQLNISDSLRLQKTWLPPEILGEESEKHEEEPMWILYQAYPHIENGAVESIMGCITDISQFKWAERVQARSADAARAAKQRLEDFIDITSHEMRNPLSAVTQCADDILNSISDAHEFLGDHQAMRDELDQMADTAKSIALCATHQRRIIDDVLTLSKLDSALLSVVPVASRPNLIISDAMRMFTAEFASSGIQVDVIDESPGALKGHEYAYFDATRLMQVLVNLITNAIKFTRAEAIREVTLRYGASDVPPSEEKFGPDFAWSSSTRKRRDLSSDTRYGEGNALYLHFSVQDTGQGLPKQEAVHIFDKFIQANRRTYIKYGGSGLGLFISRELIELQSGRIGVSSETGQGSTFAFYVKSKRGIDSQASSEARLLTSPILQASKRSRRESKSNTAPNALVDATGLIRTTAAAAAEDQPRSRIMPAATRYNLLLVEDNLVNQKVLSKQLRKAGFTVAIAHHGGEAVDRLLQVAGRNSQYDTPGLAGGSEPIPFDCVLMDWEMPVLDGLAATRKIRELEQAGVIRPRQTIIGVTANARVEQIQMAEAAGMDEIVVKPFRVPDLIARIEVAITKQGLTS